MRNTYKAVSVETMRTSDAWTIEHKVPSKELMRRAGEGIFKSGKWTPPVAIVCGTGNNAGDGYVVAELLYKAGIECTLILLSEKFSEDGKFYYDRCKKIGVPSILFEDVSTLKDFHTILDCILGTGFVGEARGKARDAIEAINLSGAFGAFVISADINSGLNGDTGMGTTFVKSDLTVSIGDFKLGHFKGLAAQAMKEKVNVDIGIEIQGKYEIIVV